MTADAQAEQQLLTMAFLTYGMKGREPSEAELAARRTLAAREFPKAWARALTIPGRRGKQRRGSLCRRALAAIRLRQLRAINASCGNCTAMGHHPQNPAQAVCLARSDHAGYSLTMPSKLCVDWSDPR